MITRETLIRLLNEKTGYDVTTPSGCAWLRLDILSVVGESVGLNTLKRLTRVLSDGGDGSGTINSRVSTLDIIARYLGYPGWKVMEKTFSGLSSAFREEREFYDMKALHVGAEAVIRWAPGRRIRIVHLGAGKYRVLEADNSKLLPADILSLGRVMKGFPFLVSEVIRNGESLGPYTAAPEYGLNSVEILQATIRECDE